MSNFLTLGHFDIWALVATLRQRRSLFAGEGPVRRAVMRYGSGAEEPEASKWIALQNTLSRARRLAPGPIEMGAVSFEMLMPRSWVGWDDPDGPEREGWQETHLALLTNPLAWLYSGIEAMHVHPGFLVWRNRAMPASQINLGEHPRVHLVIEFRPIREPADG